MIKSTADSERNEGILMVRYQTNLFITFTWFHAAAEKKSMAPYRPTCHIFHHPCHRHFHTQYNTTQLSSRQTRPVSQNLQIVSFHKHFSHFPHKQTPWDEIATLAFGRSISWRCCSEKCGDRSRTGPSRSRSRSRSRRIVTEFSRRRCRR